MPHFVCKNCQHVATQDEWITPDRAACPKCECKHFTMSGEFSLQFLPSETVKIKQRDPHHKSSKKLRREEFIGHDPNKDGMLMHKHRVIDKDANYYYEKVTDPNTGEVIRQCEEKLSDHIGRGTAKGKKLADDA